MKRIVKLHIKEEHWDTFRTTFYNNQKKIEAFEGCQGVALLESIHGEGYFFTFSTWTNEEALDNYRSSPLFKGIWAKTKLLFDGKPEAWSVEETI